MEKYKIISFNGAISESQADQIKEALKNYKIYKEYVLSESVTIILKLRKKQLSFTLKKSDINLPENM